MGRETSVNNTAVTLLDYKHPYHGRGRKLTSSSASLHTQVTRDTELQADPSLFKYHSAICSELHPLPATPTGNA